MGTRKTLSRTFTLKNRLGMHARPASLFAQAASRFKSDITVQKGEKLINGKSIIGLLTLAAEQGASLIVRACGEDAAEALDALEKLIEAKFYED